jgi:GNAT superfamily N-acetyltransferase
MTLPVRVRQAHPEDADAIARVHVASWQVAYRGQLPDELLDALSVEFRAAGWRRILGEAAGQSVIVAERGERVVGFASVGPTRDPDAAEPVGELYALYVDPTDWSTGAGRALIQAAEARLRATGAAEATLWVLASNARARRFYELAGWRADGAHKTEIERGAEFAEVRYRRSL